jgi:hypothetical protein
MMSDDPNEDFEDHDTPRTARENATRAIAQAMRFKNSVTLQKCKN